MSNEKANEIRAFLMSGSGGTFYGVDSNDVLAKGLSHSKIAGVSVREFEATLKAYGLVVDSVRGAYRLILPTANK